MAKKKATFESNLDKVVQECLYAIIDSSPSEGEGAYNLKDARSSIEPLIYHLKNQHKEIEELKEKIEELETDQEQKSEYISELEGKTARHDTVKQLRDILDAIGFPDDNYNAPDQSEYVEIGKAGIGVYVMGDCPLYLQNDIEQFLETIKNKY